MKYILIFTLLSIQSITLSQIKSSKIENGYNIYFKNEPAPYAVKNIGNYSLIDFVEALDESKPGFPKLPSRTIFLAIPPETKIEIKVESINKSFKKDVVLETNPATALENDSTIKYIKTEYDESLYKFNKYPINEVEVIGYTWLRDFYVVAIQINPYQYIFNERTLAIIDSCSFSIKFSSNNKFFEKNNSKLTLFDEMLKEVLINFYDALEFRSFNYDLILSDTTGQWIDYSKEYVKLAIPIDNVYRIGYNNLVNYGLNPGNINPKTLKIFHKGKEVPIYVFGEDDNVFNQNDYIEFYAERNYTYQNYRNIVPVGQDYIQYFDRYNDTTIVWLTWGGNNGRRAQVITSQPVTTNDTINSHIAKIHLEQDMRLWYYDPTVPRVQLPFWQENKTFTWLFVGNGGSQGINFSARDFLPSTPVSIISRLISYASNTNVNAHRFGMSLNNLNPTDTIIFNYKQTVNFSKNYSSSQLNNGNNTVRIFGLTSQAAFHQALVDWVDIDYFRRNVAVNDSLKIVIPDSVSNAIRVIRIENINSPNQIIVYKTKPTIKKFNAFNIIGSNPSQIFFIDTVRGGDEYYITSLNKVSNPVFKNKKQFVNLRSNQRGADYILLSNKSLINSVNQYKNFIQSNYNVRIELVFDEDIYDEFSFGNVEAEAIRRFLVSASSNWIEPRPTFLTIIGDANYDYKDVVTPAPTPRKKNIVTSFGNPVSDVWYVMWDSVNVNFPQMYVGRIPANNDQEVLRYLQKHQTYVQRRYDYFNKSFIFFSGGDATKPNELSQIIAANNFVMNNFVRSSPLFGNATHFYKTVNPPSNFGPYTLEEVQRVINEGGLFISYIGHSGTRTWDNSITEVEHIKNKYNNRLPLISDFGCSTGKFAEPDVDAFGELFVSQSSNGQAIAYLGNSSWGYLSTSLNFPRIFYQRLIQDSLKGLGYIHTLSKIQQLSQSGIGDVNRVFTYCNLLFGDPIVGLQIPPKPNLTISQSDIKIITEQPNDLTDTLKFRIIAKNFGIVTSDSLEILIEDVFQDSTIKVINLKISQTKFLDTLFVNIPVNNFIGVRKIKVRLDPNNRINEIYEDDNVAEFEYSINSTALQPLEISRYFNTQKDTIIVLNPFIKKPNKPERLKLEISDNENFTQTVVITKSFDTLISKVSLGNLIQNQRYYYRLKQDDLGSYYSTTYSFIQRNPNYQFFVNEGNIEGLFNYQNTIYDTSSRSWRLNTQVNTLKILSAGGHDGAFGSIQLNGIEFLPNTYYWGLATAIIDSTTLSPVSIRYFNVPDPGVSDSLANFVNRLPQNTLIAMTISADAAQGPLGWTAGTPPRNAIKTLGSRYIDSIVYREGWAILGRKGAAIGSVPEDYRKLLAGVATVEVSKTVTNDSGYIVFPEIKFAKSWNYIKFETEIPQGASITYTPIGIRKNGQTDTLFNFSTNSDSIDLSNINAEVYPSLRILAKLYANQMKESPKIFSLGARYVAAPELAINYQTVNIDRDTIWQGERVNFSARVYNVGKSIADTVKVVLDLIKADNTSYNLIDTVFLNLHPNNYKTIFYQYFNTNFDGYGNFNFKLSVDPNDSVYELIENNNIFFKPFFVKRDTATSISSSSVTVKFNNKEILDWDYVEPNSKVNVELSYPVWFPVTDTSAIQIFVNGRRIYAEKLIYDYDTIERKMKCEFDLSIESGEHNIRVFTKDVYGRISNKPVFEKYFKVSQNIEVLNVYNYPNPFKDGTNFTFVLTQIPDEIDIKIFTIAGRLIKQIKVSQNDLTTNFNKIFWDGKDEDGDDLANGVYLYKLTMRKDQKVQSVLQKLVVMK